MKEVVTKDGSITFFNESADQHYHSTSGAYDEALQKHVIPSGVRKFKGPVVLVDACFGLGYNTIVAINEIRKKNSSPITIYAFENDPLILQKVQEIDYPEELQTAVSIVRKLLHGETIAGFEFYLYPDVRVMSEVADGIVDVIFFDPFSPSKVPELWSEKIFSQCFRVLKTGGVLTTYSCARMARGNMREAGFTVSDGPSIGRRSPSTIAQKF